MAGGRGIRVVTAALALTVCATACTSDSGTAVGTTAATSPSAVRLVPPTPSTSSPVTAPRRTSERRHVPRATGSAVPAHVDGVGVFGIGDSIMVDARSYLQAGIEGIEIDAGVGRQVEPGVTILRSLAADAAVPDTTVFGLGTNGPFLGSQLSELLRLTVGHRLIVVTTHCPYCEWTDANNAMVRAECTIQRHCYLARFQGEAQRHPEWFFSDGVHLPSVGAGAWAYARIVRAALCDAGRC
jgi:hypothetical protein